MPITPFLLELRIGVDICKSSRITRIIRRSDVNDGVKRPVGLFRFLPRFLTTHEQLRFWQWRCLSCKKFTGDELLRQSTEYLASRWAAKESVIKACKPRRISFSSIEVHHDNSEPYAVVLEKPDSMRPPLVDSESDQSKRDLDKDNSRHSILELSSLLWKLSLQAWDKDSSPLEIQSGGLDSVHGQAVRLSISDDGDYVFASCLATKIS